MPHAHDRDFKRQTREFADVLKNAGTQVKLGEGYNHFEIAETIANPPRLRRARGPGADAARLKLEGLGGFERLPTD